MIDEKNARKIAEGLLGSPSSGGDSAWTITGFAEGWLIRQEPKEGFVGAGSYVVEREGGRVLTFPSAVPPQRIVDEYASVVKWGREISTDR